MSTLPEITDLFAKLATHLQTLNHTPTVNPDDVEASIDLSISSLNRSLNLNEEHSRVRVLDAALSLMCFKAPQVFDSMIEYLVKTIVSVLSGSISCEVFRFRKDEVLQIGSSLSCYECVGLIEACADVLNKLEGHELLSHSLLRAVLRIVVSTSYYQRLFPFMPILDVRSTYGRSTTIRRMLWRHLPKELLLENLELPLRLLFWYIEPLTLKQDVSKILQDTMERPFICLDKEFRESMDWHSIILCLIISPTMFIETRALLHNWFLVTGLASILEFLIELVSVILDVLSRPTWWGISMELGSKLPFSNAYFPHNRYLLRTLAGPLSLENFRHLVRTTYKPVSNDNKQFDPTIEPTAMKVAALDYRSNWALATNFPDWFYFASVVLFSKKSFLDNLHSEGTMQEPTVQQGHEYDRKSPSCSAAAARYIAWILSPHSQCHQDMLVDCLTKVAESWTLKQSDSAAHDKGTTGYKKKLKKPKFQDNEAFNLVKGYDSRAILLLLKEFQNTCTMYWNKTVNSSATCDAKSTHGLSLQQNALFRRIPLGILIWPSSYINEDGCELLLHYATTGRMLQSEKLKSDGFKHVKYKFEGRENSTTWIDEYSKKEALAGVGLVFSINDIADRMSPSLFESEERGLDFIFQVKVRTGIFLIKCIKKILHFTDNEDGVLMLKDLSSRLVRWRHQGKSVFPGQTDLDELINALNYKLSSISGEIF